ncbi:hypothetical protein F2Q69_00030212 [Brassica cretica]|uniref:Uncharacterized protein n=1 Tax=Brassica cretica TaxID=69181 RepID=A0A8S9RYE4_BRACR|nr:hypothetical protein F2Q69_00030212 [Brassica cretica]
MTWITRSCHVGETGADLCDAVLRFLTLVSVEVAPEARVPETVREVRHVWPHGHRHPFCLLDRPVLVYAPVSISGVPSWSLRGFLISLGSVWSDRLGILLLLRFGTAGDVFLPFDLRPGSRQDVFNGFVLVFGQLLVEVSVGEQTSLESRDRSRDTAFGDSHLLLIEAGYVALQGFRPVLEDFVEAVEGLLQVHAAGKLLHKLVAENRKGGYGPGAGAVIRLYAGERELPRHLDQGDLIREGSIGVGVRVALPDGASYPRESLYHRLHGVEPIGEHLVKRGSWEPGFLPAGILGTGVPSSGDPEAGILPGRTHGIIIAKYCEIHGAIKTLLLQTWKAAKPGTWVITPTPAPSKHDAKSKQVSGVALPRKAEYGPGKTKYSRFLRTPGLKITSGLLDQNPQVIKNIWVPKQSPGPEKISGPGKGKPPGSYITSGSNRPLGSKETSGFPNDLQVPSRPPGPKYDLRV